GAAAREGLPDRRRGLDDAARRIDARLSRRPLDDRRDRRLGAGRGLGGAMLGWPVAVAAARRDFFPRLRGGGRDPGFDPGGRVGGYAAAMTPFSARYGFSSPVSNISFTMSQPPTNSPFT